MFERILVPTDFSPCAEEALGVAIEVAKKFESQITLAHAVEPPTYAYVGMMGAVDLVTPLQEAAREMMKTAFASLKQRWDRSECVLLFGTAGAELLAAIDKHRIDLVVIGTHGRTGLSHALLGSVAERVVRTAPVPVLTVRSQRRRSGTKET